MKSRGMMMMVLVSGVLLGGCMFQSAPYREVRHFDLGRPDSVSMPVPVRVVSFDAAPLYGARFLYRTGASEVIVDEYNRWFQLPGALVAHYLRRALLVAPEDVGGAVDAPESVRISGRVLEFEFDLGRRVARLVVVGELRRRVGARERVERFREVVEAALVSGRPSPDELARGMSDAAAEFVDRLVRRVRGMTE